MNATKYMGICCKITKEDVVFNQLKVKSTGGGQTIGLGKI